MSIKVYIAAAFRRFSARDNNSNNLAYGILHKNSYTDFLESIESTFIKKGYITCLPHRDEGHWGKKYYPPETISAICYRHVLSSDIIVAIAEDGRGVHLELGFAAGLGNKTIIMFYHESHEPSTLIWGLSSISHKNNRIHIYKYTDIQEIQKILAEIIPDITKNTIMFSPFNKAIVDIGSHTIKLNIFRIFSQNSNENIYNESYSLGIIDSINNGILEKNVLNKLFDLLKNWQQRIESYHCSNTIVIGTKALRITKNIETLNDIINSLFHTNLKVLSKENEQSLIQIPIIRQFNSNLPIAILNLGGGSIQFSVVEDSIQKYNIVIDFGTNYITSKWKWDKAIKRHTFRKIVNNIKKIIEEEHSLSNPSCVMTHLSYMIHTGGELDFLLSCLAPLKYCRVSKTHVSQISRRDFTNFAYDFCNNDIDQAVIKYSLDKKWLSGSIASNAIAIAFMELYNIRILIPSNLNISDGLILE